ncbi:hypothetical protein ACFZB2_39410 [Streptomyces bobili]|uniref:hypothetical protein n=1 Tax=Streptomyces bobili TaxID=67280 RepID=UPI0036EDE529
MPDELVEEPRQRTCIEAEVAHRYQGAREHYAQGVEIILRHERFTHVAGRVLEA